MGTSLYEINKGKIMKIDMGRRIMGCLALPKMVALASFEILSKISFSS